MKKIFTLIFIFSAVILRAQTSYYQHYFEGPASQNQLTIAIGTNTDNIWQIGVPSKTLFSGAYSPSNAMITLTSGVYPNSNLSTFTMAVPHYTGTSFWPFALQWSQKLDMEASQDGGIVEFSMDGGQTWQNTHNNPNVYQYYGFQPANVSPITAAGTGFTGTDNVWRSIWCCITASVANSNDTICYRFTFKSDANQTNQEGWIIDNFNAHTTVFHPVKEHSLKYNVTVYPNTTSGIVNIEAKKNRSDEMIDNIALVDINGRIVEDYGRNYSKTVIDISKHPPGTYYFTIRIGKKVESYQVIYVKE